jgi:hypothetical protein
VFDRGVKIRTSIFSTKRFSSSSSRARTIGILLSQVSTGTARGTRDAQRIHFFSWAVYLSGLDNGLVSCGRACYRLFLPFSIPGESPRDQRGKPGSGNRRLGFEIRADNRRFPEGSRTEWQLSSN